MSIELDKLFSKAVQKKGNLLFIGDAGEGKELQTRKIFSDKWSRNSAGSVINGIREFQLDWYLRLYGFSSEQDLKEFLTGREVILDAGCGLGYKAAWLAGLAPESVVIGMDYSNSVYEASDYYGNIDNLFFVKGDISDTFILQGTVDFINCDQVIHHTEDPEKTFQHLCSLLRKDGEITCYVYARKALPRELLDDHFRSLAPECSSEELWKFAEQVTQLGKTLTEMNQKIVVPDIPLLGIKGGEYDLQRFLYWNFMKCFWNEQVGWDNSVLTNFDWYSPARASRYTEEEFKQWIVNNGLLTRYFHREEACYSGRFSKA